MNSDPIMTPPLDPRSVSGGGTKVVRTPIRDIMALFPEVVRVSRVGSRATCLPPPVDTDEDFLVLYAGVEPVDIDAALAGHGFQTTTDLEYIAPDGSISPFVSYKRGDLNLLVTADAAFHKKFLAATHVAKSLNLMRKQDRVMLFQAVLYGEIA